MKQLAAIIALALTPMAGKLFTSAIDTMSRPMLTGIALTMFSGFFIFTVMTAKSPVQFQWKPKVRISPEVMEHLTNAAKLAGTMMIFFVVAVILVAIAATGPGLSFPQALLMVMKSLPRMLDV